MILAQNWPKPAKSSWHCPFKDLTHCIFEMKTLLPCGLCSRSTTLITSLNFSDNTGRRDALNSFTLQKNKDQDQEEEQNGRTSSKHVDTHKYHRLDIFSTCFYSKYSYQLAESQ